ncbi:MAG: EamA family transporter [Acidobacteriota bacterium]|nr:EamA family transporter [Acidobacteriota bacterium]
MEPSQTGRASRVMIVLAFGTIYIVWGGTYLAIKFAVQTIPPFGMAGARFVLAGALLYAFLRLRGTAPPLRKHWLSASAVGAVLLVGGNSSLVWAEQRVPSGLAATILAMIPLWMVLLDGLRKGGPKLTVRVACGLVIGLAGVGLLVGPARLWGSSRVDVLGAAVLMFSAFCWAVGSLCSRGANLPSSPFLAAAMEMLAGGTILIVIGVLFEGHQLHWRAISFRSMTGLFYLVVFGSLVSFTAYIWLLSVVSTSRVATYAYVNPAVAVFLGWAFGAESISARELLATGIIIAAVALILSHHPPPAAMAPDADGLPTIDEERLMGVGEN